MPVAAATPCSASWLPIESAPKDGTKILAGRHRGKGQTYFGAKPHGEVSIAWWESRTRTVEIDAGNGLVSKVEEHEWEGWSTGYTCMMTIGEIKPTHWIPIPPLLIRWRYFNICNRVAYYGIVEATTIEDASSVVNERHGGGTLIHIAKCK